MHDKQKTSRHRWIAYAAACWALIFAVFHIVWAAGWYILLDPVEAAAAFASPWMLAYDLVVAGMCMVAVPVALALALPRGRRVPRRLLLPLALIGVGLLALRAVASLVQVAYFAAIGRFRFEDLGVWEPWFYVGAALFTLDLWWYGQRERPAPPNGRALANARRAPGEHGR
ncbi:MAG: hypothetical protein AB7U82_25505 [Blastocatellales bacterium]